MPTLLLISSPIDRDCAVALGAEWDKATGQCTVPAGVDLVPFAPWLPQDVASSLTASRGASTELSPLERGVSLSKLLQAVQHVLARSFDEPVWVRAEVANVKATDRAVSLELTEAGLDGRSVAQARAVIFRSTANQIVPAFEAATGIVLGAGIKLLVRATPEFHPIFGLSLKIHAIDPTYSLGEIEARKRRIRLRLQQEGLFDLNRSLPSPWDFRGVLVLAPQGAAGLGDFQSSAARLHEHGVCRFVYVHARFQGPQAAGEMVQALRQGLSQWQRDNGSLPDAVVVIRGGGATNDLMWLDDYALARALCECPVPVMTGIGHERDNTVLDEVAARRYDTPSKVIEAIKTLIRGRALRARTAQRDVMETARRQLSEWSSGIRDAQQAVVGRAQSQLKTVREDVQAQRAGVEQGVRSLVRRVQRTAQDAAVDVREAASRQLAQAQAQVPAVRREVQQLAVRALFDARRYSAEHRDESLRLARQAAVRWTERTDADQRSVVDGAGRAVLAARAACDDARQDVGVLATAAAARVRAAADGAVDELGAQASRTLAGAAANVEALVHDGLAADIRRTVQLASRSSADLHELVNERAGVLARQGASAAREAMATVADEARRAVATAAEAAQALMREVAGQGPEKTLGRGFVVARDADGEPVTSAAAAAGRGRLELQFKDGTVGATVHKTQQEGE